MADERTTMQLPDDRTGLPGSAAAPPEPPWAGLGPPHAGPPAGVASAGPDAPPPAPPAPPPAEASPVGPPAPPPGGGRRRALGALAVVALMLGAGAGGAVIAQAFDDDPEAAPATSLSPTASRSTGAADEPDEALSQVAAAVLPSVVSITLDASAGTAEGSGVVISSDGQILTNNHVVAGLGDGGDLTVTFSNGDRASAEIVGRDPATDLAVIQADDVSDLTPATLGSSADLHVGDTVVAIGSPLGLSGSVTSGIVSALSRGIALGGESQGQPFGGQESAQVTAAIDAIQTDAAINPGNSGGALVNTDGEVIGIPTAIASTAGGGLGTSQSGNIGVGFAIPIDDARDVAQQLIDDGEATHAYLGVQIGDSEEGSGAVVGGVESGGPAAEAGLQEGDLVTAVDDHEVSDAADLTAAIRSLTPGDQVTVTYTRDGDEHTADVTLAELPEQQQ